MWSVTDERPTALMWLIVGATLVCLRFCLCAIKQKKGEKRLHHLIDWFGPEKTSIGVNMPLHTGPLRMTYTSASAGPHSATYACILPSWEDWYSCIRVSVILWCRLANWQCPPSYQRSAMINGTYHTNVHIFISSSLSAASLKWKNQQMSGEKASRRQLLRSVLLKHVATSLGRCTSGRSDGIAKAQLGRRSKNQAGRFSHGRREGGGVPEQSHM